MKVLFYDEKVYRNIQWDSIICKKMLNCVFVYSGVDVVGIVIKMVNCSSVDCTNRSKSGNNGC